MEELVDSPYRFYGAEKRACAIQAPAANNRRYQLPNSDQLKYLKDKEPTPLHRHAKREPQPITLPTNPRTFEAHVQQLVRATVLETLYSLMRSEETLNIATMTFQEFEDFAARVKAEEDI